MLSLQQFSVEDPSPDKSPFPETPRPSTRIVHAPLAGTQEKMTSLCSEYITRRGFPFWFGALQAVRADLQTRPGVGANVPGASSRQSGAPSRIAPRPCVCFEVDARQCGARLLLQHGRPTKPPPPERSG